VVKQEATGFLESVERKEKKRKEKKE